MGKEIKHEAERKLRQEACKKVGVWMGSREQQKTSCFNHAIRKPNTLYAYS